MIKTKTRKELFDMMKEFDDVFGGDLKGIVQNEHSICENEMSEWNNKMKDLECKLDEAYKIQKSKILELYMEMQIYYGKQEKVNADN